MIPSVKILLVDDDHSILTTTRYVLENVGYDVLPSAQNGAQALTLAHTYRPDLVLLDVGLPDISGTEVCRQIKSDPSLEGTSVIMLSAAYTDSDSQAQGLESGADGYIARPINNRELRARIETMLRLKTTETELRKKEKQTRALYESMSEMFILYELVYDSTDQPVDYRLLDCNFAFEHISGIGRQQAIGKLASHLYDADEPLYLDHYKTVVETGVPISFETEIPIWGKWLSISAFSPEKGRFATVCTDITEHRQQELAKTKVLLAQAEQAQQTLLRILDEHKKVEIEIKHHLSELEVLYESSISLSRLLNPQEISQQLIKILKSKLDWHHTTIRMYHPQTEKIELLAVDWEYLNTPETIVTNINNGFNEWVIRNRQIIRSNNVQADDRYVETYPGIHSGLYAPLQIGDEIIGVISVESERENAFSQQDEKLLITLASQAAIAIKNAQLFTTLQKARDELEQHVIERTAELNQSNIELIKANRLKDEFLSSMSHELRTPLTGILSLSESLQMKTYGELSERQLRAIHNIEISGRHLLELINDILDLSRIESGKWEIHLEECIVSEICQASLQLTKDLVQKKQQQVYFTMTPATITFTADARRLKQMIVNLISNAIKFTPNRGQLGLEVEGDETNRLVKFIVWDKGIGIKPEDISQLFKPFVQIDGRLARQYNGTGLGLSLVKRMAEIHGGSVEVESVFGEGSRFTIILPWKT